MKEYILFQVKTFDATGGYSPSYLTEHLDLKSEGHSSTRSGVFVIDSIGPHVSSGRWIFSTIEYGTPMEERSGIIYIKKKGVWVKIREVARFRKMEDYIIVRGIKKMNKFLTGSSDVPKTWIFNDFGHIAIKYFVDSNHNYKKDGKESIISDFIHSTQPDELNDASGAKRTPLSNSHGCVHVYPKDIDAMIAAHYLKKGNIFEVHDYYESVPITLKRKRHKYLPNEIHFFPKDNKLVVYGLTDTSTVKK